MPWTRDPSEQILSPFIGQGRRSRKVSRKNVGQGEKRMAGMGVLRCQHMSTPFGCPPRFSSSPLEGETIGEPCGTDQIRLVKKRQHLRKGAYTTCGSPDSTPRKQKVWVLKEAIRWRPSLLGWRPSLLVARALLVKGSLVCKTSVLRTFNSCSTTTHHTPLIIHHSSYTTHHTPLIIHHSSYTTHHTPLIIHHSSSTPLIHHSYTTHHTPLIIHHSSYTTHHTPLIIHHSSYTTHHTPLIIHDSSYTTHHTPLIIHHSSYTTHHTPLIIHHSSYTTHHTPLIIHHSSYTTHHTPLIIHD